MGRTLDLQRQYPDGRTDDILAVHRLDADDKTPLQMISAALLTHYQHCAAQLLALQERDPRHREAED